MPAGRWPTVDIKAKSKKIAFMLAIGQADMTAKKKKKIAFM